MGRQKIRSREYKVMLRPNRFAGDEKALLNAAEEVWRDFSRRINNLVVETGGKLGQVKSRRLITFFDTARHHLNRSGYILRERRDIETGEREITLKFRHKDRYLAQGRTMDVRNAEDAKTKFEEDIKAPFVSNYSFSTTFRIAREGTLNSLGDVARLVPQIVETLDGSRKDDALAAVNGFTARELVIRGAHLQIGKTPKVDAECALIVWYDHNRGPEKPVAVELSYRYGDDDENYGVGMTRRAFDVFTALPTELDQWVSAEARTKTAFVYG